MGLVVRKPVFGGGGGGLDKECVKPVSSAIETSLKSVIYTSMTTHITQKTVGTLLYQHLRLIMISLAM